MTAFLELGDYCEVAAELLGTSAEQIARLPGIGLAASALAAPRAGFGDRDAYPGLIGKGAVLVEHLARNHPLPDGNKRAAFISVWLFMEANGRPFTEGDPDTDVPTVERIAAGEATREEVVRWLEDRTAPAPRLSDEIDPSRNRVLPRESAIGEAGIEALWLEAFPKYPRLRHDGSTLLVRLYPEREIGKWLRGGKRNKPTFDREAGQWEVPFAWLGDLIARSVDRYGGVVVIRDSSVVEKCAPSCVNAESPVTECICSCGGANHATGALPAGFYVINEALAVRVADDREAAVTFITRRGPR